MSRDEYLNDLQEGFIKDTVKRGWEKVKSLFRIGIQKVKNFIAIFDDKGNVLPVISPQAIIDNFSGSDSVKVYASKSLSDSTIEAGGNGCDENPQILDDNEIYDEGPKGKEYAKWLKEKKYKDSIEYKNFMSIPEALKESFVFIDAEQPNERFYEYIDESWEGVSKERVHYVDKDELRGIHQIDVDYFEKKINKLINDWCINQGKNKIRLSDNKVGTPMRNMLVFGAPGIGKSTVPNAVVKKYNEISRDDPSKMISIISINCANLDEGDFMMPTMPKEINVTRELGKFSKAFPEANSALDALDAEQREEVANTIYHSGQFKATDAPKSWLPSYRETGDDFIDSLLNDAANGGVYKDDDNRTKKVGGGGIILLDEFLRCKPGVFGQLMNFLLERRLNGWVLGSKWAIIACSNRPCDDDEVSERWGDLSPAGKDRYTKFYQLVPNPEGWKKWAKSKGCDELLIDFIFEKSSMVGDEYPRWHSMVNHGEGDSYQGKPITPRQWEAVFTEINSFEIDEDLADLSEMKKEDLAEILYGSFDDEFVAEILDWMDDHMDKIDLEGIMSNPKSVYIPKKFVNDPNKALILIQNLEKEFISKYKEDMDGFSDDELANIFIWLGMNYPGDMFNVQTFLEHIIKELDMSPDSEHSISKYIKTLMVINAAYPQKSIEQDVEAAMSETDGKYKNPYPWPKDSMEIIKGYMREYFPDRINGDEIQYYDDLKV